MNLGAAFQSADVTFFCHGARIGAELFLPVGPGPWPVIVICPGWGGLRDYPRGREFCRRFASAGVGALIFNYRGYGDSEGQPGQLIPRDMVADVRAAVAYLAGRPDVDRSGIAAMGRLTGGAVALVAASETTGIAAVIAWAPFADGSDWMRSLRSNWGWAEFVERVRQDRITAATTGESESVDPLEILPRDPGAAKAESALRDTLTARRAWRLTLASADAIMSFRPADHLHRIAPRPALIVAIEDDTLMPIEVARAAYNNLREPKRLILIKGVRHHDIYTPTHLDPLFAEFMGFLKSAFSSARRKVVREGTGLPDDNR